MNLYQLRYFLELAEKRQYTKAARQLNITQPSLSYAISQLENELGVKLFEKDGRTISLTDCGRDLAGCDINPNQPSLVTIEAVCDSKIYYLPYSKLEDFFATNAETVQIKCALVEQSYSLMYHRLLDMYCKTTEELYLDLLNRCPDIQEFITLKEVASFLHVTPETISRIRRKLNK